MQVISGRRAAQVRGTQTLVDQMGWMLRHPGIVARRGGVGAGSSACRFCWFAGRACNMFWRRCRSEESGLSRINAQNPWIAAGATKPGLVAISTADCCTSCVGLRRLRRWPGSSFRPSGATSAEDGIARRQLSAGSDGCAADRLARALRRHMLGLVSHGGMGCGDASWNWRRARPDRIFDLAHFSVAGIFHAVGAAGLGGFGRARCSCCLKSRSAPSALQACPETGAAIYL